MEGSQKNLKIELPHRPASPRLTCARSVGNSPSKRRAHAHVHGSAHDELEVEAPHVSVDMVDKENVVRTNSGTFSLKKEEILSHAASWTHLEHVVLGK